MRVTLKDIAQKANVNEATVSYVLNKKPKALKFKAETRKRIFDIAQELNYKPNAAARALSTNKTGNIGFILSDQVEGLWENPYWAQMLTGVEKVCRKKNIGLLINAYNLDNLDKFVYPRHLEQSNVDGLILTGYIPKEIIDKFEKFKIPFVCLGDNLEVPQKNAITYSFDMTLATLKAIQAAHDNGHVKIACTVANCRVPIERFDEIKSICSQTMKEVELIPVRLPTLSCNNDSVDLVFEQIFNLPKSKQPTLLITSIQTCFGMILKLRKEGLCCPQSLSLISIMDNSSCKYSDPSLSVINFNLQKLGAMACENLIDHLSNNIPLKNTILKGDSDIKIIIRESCKKLNNS